jgi:hypothetical protein
MNRVVARYANGTMLKGFTTDFNPSRDRFHLTVADAPVGSRPVEVVTAELKALFFVKDFAGNRDHVEPKEFDPAGINVGRKVRVQFKDGEVLLGTTVGYQPGRQGLFLVPADASSNIVRCYIPAVAAQEIAVV